MIASFFQKLGHAIYVFFDFMGHLLTAVIDRFGHAFMWVWGFVLLSMVTVSFSLYLLSFGARNIDSTSWNGTVLQKIEPIIQSILDVKQSEIEEEILKELDEQKAEREAMEALEEKLKEDTSDEILEVGAVF